MGSTGGMGSIMCMGSEHGVHHGVHHVNGVRAWGPPWGPPWVWGPPRVYMGSTMSMESAHGYGYKSVTTSTNFRSDINAEHDEEFLRLKIVNCRPEG